MENVFIFLDFLEYFYKIQNVVWKIRQYIDWSFFLILFNISFKGIKKRIVMKRDYYSNIVRHGASDGAESGASEGYDSGYSGGEFYSRPKNSEVTYPSEYSTDIEKEAYYEGYISEYPSAYKKAYSEGLNERLKKSVAWYSIIIYTREV